MATIAVKRQGRIHGYPSHVRVGRGYIWGHMIICEETEVKDRKNKQKSKVWWTDRQMDGSMNW